jgi:hypothetical protein
MSLSPYEMCTAMLCTNLASGKRTAGEGDEFAPVAENEQRTAATRTAEQARARREQKLQTQALCVHETQQ